MLFALLVQGVVLPSRSRPPVAAPGAALLHTRGGCRLFLDTAVVSEWEELLPTGMFHGVTTNPTLLERAGEACTLQRAGELAQTAFRLGASEFMLQTWGATAGEMVSNGVALSVSDPGRIVVKVPVTVAGTTAAAAMTARGVRVCLTACYGRQQALVAGGVGAEYLAPYLGRMTDAGKDGMFECEQMQAIVDGLGSTTRILVASIRDVDALASLAASGIDTFTFSPAIARALFEEPLTTAAAAEFEAAA